MDVVLGVTVVVAVTVLSRRAPPPANRSLFVRLCLMLSFSLLALGVLDAIPAYWNLVLSRDAVSSPLRTTSSSHIIWKMFPLSMAYRYLFWAIATTVVIIGPCMVGSQMVSKLETLVMSVGNWLLWWLLMIRPSRWQLRQQHWSIRMMYLMLYATYKAIAVPLCLLWNRKGSIFSKICCCCCCSSRRRTSSTTLPMHNNNSKTTNKTTTTKKPISVLSFLRLVGRPLCRMLVRYMRYILGSALGILFTLMALHVAGPLVIPRQHHHHYHHSNEMLNVVGDPTTTTSSSSSVPPAAAGAASMMQQHLSALAPAISNLTAVGVVVSALLNGFGSVSLPFSCLAGLFLEPVTNDALQVAVQELDKARTSLNQRQAQLANPAASSSSLSIDIASSPPSSSGTTSAAVVRSSTKKNKSAALMRAMSWTGSAGGGGGGGSAGAGGATTTTTSSSTSRTSMSSTNMTTTTSFSELGEVVTQRRKQLALEIVFLQQLVDELADDVSEMRHARAMAAAARTRAGRIRSYVGIVFSIVLLVRLVAAAMSVPSNIIITTASTTTTGGAAAAAALPSHHHHRRTDPVTLALLWLMGDDHHEYYNTMSQCTSLVLTAVLSVTQVRNFWRTVHAVNRLMTGWYQKCYCKPSSSQQQSNNNSSRSEAGTIGSSSQKTALSQHSGSSSDTTNTSIAAMMMVHIVSSLLTCYCLACSVLTKNLLPAQYRSSFSTAMGGPEIFHVRLYAVNMLFLGSALVSAAVLGGLLAIQRSNTVRYSRSSSSGVLDGGGASGDMMPMSSSTTPTGAAASPKCMNSTSLILDP